MNSRKKRFVNPIKIEVTRRARTEMILGKSPAIYNGHQPPRADDPYSPKIPKPAPGSPKNLLSGYKGPGNTQLMTGLPIIFILDTLN